MDTEQNTELSRLDTILTIGNVVSLMSQVLLVIANKRVTLAEKGIRSELYECIYLYTRIIASLAKLAKNENYALALDDNKVLADINSWLVEALSAFLKASAHSLNYLEQYFEHDFWESLGRKNISVELAKIHLKLEDNKH